MYSLSSAGRSASWADWASKEAPANGGGWARETGGRGAAAKTVQKLTCRIESGAIELDEKERNPRAVSVAFQRPSHYEPNYHSIPKIECAQTDFKCNIQTNQSHIYAESFSVICQSIPNLPLNFEIPSSQI